ncbi:hypothetical protein [Anaeroselena agilis]|uniref:Uncharacterized protein n=1 Tax=Anaeroselena agilis TaxID=3063788 RepID=A0ABU3NWC5_9FIRM|nr:hypothetical protein [Selenomonadales bacterium 4137-cl]
MQKKGHQVFGTALIMGGVLISAKVLEWHMIEVLGPISVSVVRIVIWAAFGAAALWAVYYFADKLREKRLMAAAPAIILATAFAVAWLAPMSEFVREANFRVNLVAREQVVAMVRAGELADTDLRGKVVLPDRLSYLSAGGEIAVFKVPDRVTVFFYSHRGILMSAGFAYVSDNVFGEYDCGHLFGKRIKLQDYWYYGESRL